MNRSTRSRASSDRSSVIGAEPSLRRVAGYFLAALGWTWAALGLALASGASANEPPTSWLRLLAGVGPVVAATAMLHCGASPGVQRMFWRRVVDIRPLGARWWVIVVVAASGPGVVAWAVMGDRDIDVSGSGSVLAVLAFAAAAAFAEEPGWRGYALDGMRSRPGWAAVVLSAVWAVWHLPLYAIGGTFQHDLVGFGTAFFWIIQAAFLPQTVLMIWILERTRPSILPAVVFHALVNVSGELLAYSTTQQALRLGIWVLLAAVAVARWTLASSHPGPRPTEPNRDTSQLRSSPPPEPGAGPPSTPQVPPALRDSSAPFPSHAQQRRGLELPRGLPGDFAPVEGWGRSAAR